MPLGSMKSYNPQNSLFVFGAFPIGDFADGTFLNFTFPDKIWDVIYGADGTAMRTLNLKGFAGSCEVTLLQGSQSNEVFQGILDADLAANVPVPLLFKDLDSTAMVITAANTFVEKIPNIGRAANAQTNVVWNITIPRAITGIAGYKG